MQSLQVAPAWSRWLSALKIWSEAFWMKNRKAKRDEKRRKMLSPRVRLRIPRWSA